jgi:Na+/H+ antiporter NhaD/arsenite permease-like protein
VEEGKMEEMDGKEGMEEIDRQWVFFFIGLFVLSKDLAISHP